MEDKKEEQMNKELSALRRRVAELESEIQLLQKQIDGRRNIEEELLQAEKWLQIHTEELTESNVALKVLLKQREQDQKEFENNILSNVKHLRNSERTGRCLMICFI